MLVLVTGERVTKRGECMSWRGRKTELIYVCVWNMAQRPSFGPVATGAQTVNQHGPCGTAAAAVIGATVAAAAAASTGAQLQPPQPMYSSVRTQSYCRVAATIPSILRAAELCPRTDSPPAPPTDVELNQHPKQRQDHLEDRLQMRDRTKVEGIPGTAAERLVSGHVVVAAPSAAPAARRTAAACLGGAAAWPPALHWHGRCKCKVNGSTRASQSISNPGPSVGAYSSQLLLALRRCPLLCCAVGWLLC